MKPAELQRAVDDHMARFYAVFDNRAGRSPALDDVAACFIAEAVIIQKISSQTKVYSVREFAEPRVALLNDGRLQNFHEWEVQSSTTFHDEYATRVSQYEKNGVMAGEPYQGRGTKIVQLALMQEQWRIVSLCWFDQKAWALSDQLVRRSGHSFR